ncbi:GvpL/GvpF family gas vesicle protein [Candidatus Parcubacteria bacterium]|nr:GvpL/GvpF family gas vesicle protein [Candidatus Parcubacteria bacterium]
MNTVEGKYLYCIISTNQDRNFGPIGIGGRGDIVSTISFNGLAGVISNSPMDKYEISRENLPAHEKVIEEVMKDYTVLPVRFCTIASNAEDIRRLLQRGHTEFKNLLHEMDNKIELGVKAVWWDMSAIFAEIASENKEIKKLKEKLSKKPSRQGKMKLRGLTPAGSSPPSAERNPPKQKMSLLRRRIRLGEMVESALSKKKEKEASEILRVLKRHCADFKQNKLFGDRMVLNAAFLLDRDWEKDFDHRVKGVAEKLDQRMKFAYVGPVPPFNFVNLVVEWK